MHISLDAALQRQPLLSTVGDKLLPAFPGAAAAYSLRALNGDANDVVKVRRDADNEERDFTAEGVQFEVADWVNGKQESTLPADVATAAAAYSLRKVKADYSGDAVRIRRASDDVEVDVAFDANDEVSTSSAITNVTESPDAGDTTATTLGAFLTEGGNQDATVQTWYDQSGNGYNLTQDTAGSQPKIAEAGALLTLSGKPTIRPDGSDDFLINENAIWDTISNTNLSCMVVTEKTSVVNKVLWAIGSSSAEDGDWLIGGGSIAGNVQFRGGRINSAVSSIGTSGEVLLTALDVSGGDGFVDGTAIGSPTSVSPNVTADRLVLFTRRGSSSTGTCTDQDVSEIIFYNSDQSSNRFKIESNINNHFDLTNYDDTRDGFVNTWYDQSGNSNDAVSPADTNEPQIVSAGSLLADGIDFDGSDDHFDLNNVFTGTDGVSSFFVGNADTTATGEAMFCQGDLSGALGSAYSVSSEIALRVAGSAVFDDDFIDANTLLLSVITPDAGTTTDAVARLNGTQLSQTSSTGATLDYTNQAAKIGKRFASAPAYDGSLKELIIYDSDQSSNRTDIEANINNHYSIF